MVSFGALRGELMGPPRALKLRKIYDYIEEKLGPAPSAHGYLLICGDKPLRADMSLSTVRAFFWKQRGDMVISYCQVPMQPAACSTRTLAAS